MWARIPFNVTDTRDILIRTTKLHAMRVGQAILGAVKLCSGCDLVDVTSRNPYALHRVLKQRAHRHAMCHNASSHHTASPWLPRTSSIWFRKRAQTKNFVAPCLANMKSSQPLRNQVTWKTWRLEPLGKHQTDNRARNNLWLIALRCTKTWNEGKREVAVAVFLTRLDIPTCIMRTQNDAQEVSLFALHASLNYCDGRLQHHL